MLTDFLNHTKAFALARVLMTAIELDVFRILDQEPTSRTALEQRLAIPDTPIADAVINILIAFGFIGEDDHKLRLLPLGASILPAYESIQLWNKEMQLFYSSLDDLTGVLKSGRYQDSVLSDYWAYKKDTERKKLELSSVDDYSSLLDASQEQLSEIIVNQYDFSTHKHIIDFGGGYGRLAVALAERYPDLNITIADLPAVCEGANERINAAGLGERIDFLPGDFVHDDLPSAVADAIIFVRVMHDWNDQEVMDLTARTKGCLRKPGVLIIVEPITDETAKPDLSSVQSSLMVTLWGGRRRSVQQYIKLLSSVGYTQVNWYDCGLSIYKMIVAHI